MMYSETCRGRLDNSFGVPFPNDSTNYQISVFVASPQTVAFSSFGFAPDIGGRARAQHLSGEPKNGRDGGCPGRATNRRQNYYIFSVPFLTDLGYPRRCNDIVVLA
jgi:hypothetical protein